VRNETITMQKKAVRRNKYDPLSPLRLIVSLPLIDPNTPRITPYTPTTPRGIDHQFPASPARIHPSNTTGESSDISRYGDAAPKGRFSCHKPPFVPLNLDANATHSASGAPVTTVSQFDNASNVTRQGKVVPSLSSRRPGYYQLPFLPLPSANATGVIPNALGATSPFVEVSRPPSTYR
jgi:hypothetical protein